MHRIQFFLLLLSSLDISGMQFDGNLMAFVFTYFIVLCIPLQIGVWQCVWTNSEVLQEGAKYT